MNTNRQNDRVFRYVRDILSTNHRDTGVPVVFGLVKVNNAIVHFRNYLGYLLADENEPRTGELKRAVRQIFERTSNSTIGDGTVPRLEGTKLSAPQVAELAYHVLALDEKMPVGSTRNWKAEVRSWLSLFVKYNARHCDLWEGFKRTSLAANGTSIMIYRMFILASGITHGTRFDPTNLNNTILPQSNSTDYPRFKNTCCGNANLLDEQIRSKIWNGFLAEQNPHYLAAGVPKPSYEPHSSTAMLEMFDCYFNCRAYTYEQHVYSIEAAKGLKIAKIVLRRYWPMIGTLAVGPIVSSNPMLGMISLAGVLFFWHKQRQVATPLLRHVPYWNPNCTAAYGVLCALTVGTSWFNLIVPIPFAIFAHHLGREWDEIKTTA